MPSSGIRTDTSTSKARSPLDQACARACGATRRGSGTVTGPRMIAAPPGRNQTSDGVARQRIRSSTGPTRSAARSPARTSPVARRTEPKVRIHCS